MKRFRELEAKDPLDLEPYFNLFLEDWKEYSFDAIETDIETNSRLEKISRAKAFKRILDEVETEFYGIIDKFNCFNDPFLIYREIKGIGIFWSWDKSKAEAHWTTLEKDLKTIFITALVKKKDVDWAKTIIKNLHLHLGKDEAEIQLEEGISIEIIEIEDDNDKTIPLNVKALSYIKKTKTILKSGTYQLLSILDPEKDAFT